MSSRMLTFDLSFWSISVVSTKTTAFFFIHAYRKNKMHSSRIVNPHFSCYFLFRLNENIFGLLILNLNAKSLSKCVDILLMYFKLKTHSHTWILPRSCQVWSVGRSVCHGMWQRVYVILSWHRSCDALLNTFTCSWLFQVGVELGLKNRGVGTNRSKFQKLNADEDGSCR